MYINSHHKRADELMDEQKYDKALTAFNKALEKNPKNPIILSQRGVLFLHMNKKKKCLDDLNLALELEPENSYRFASRAYAKDFFGNLDGAIEDYEKAVKLDPSDAVAHNNLGLLLEKKGYQNKAQQKFERADRLAKVEKKFFDKLDEAEGITDTQTSNSPSPSSGEKLQPKKLEIEKAIKSKNLFIQVFTKKSVFKEFVSFIKNGFKIKDNDQKGKG
jgi:tetratricopeptide (TPR) repeat protein